MKQQIRAPPKHWEKIAQSNRKLFLCRQFLKKVMRKNSTLRGMGKCSVPMLYQEK